VAVSSLRLKNPGTPSLTAAGAQMMRAPSTLSIVTPSSGTVTGAHRIQLGDCFTLDMFRYQPGYFRISRELSLLLPPLPFLHHFT
jgi:hypothetical protein